MKSTNKIIETELASKSAAVSKKVIVFCVLFFAVITPIFCQANQITQLDSWATKVLELFQSTWVKAILLIALIVEAIGVVVAGQQGGGGQMLKKFAPWIIGTIVLLSASGICSYFLQDLSFKLK
ncbi:MAG: TrbC/VirB2 family protein [Treponema sp.]|nr:TrbC/VirB2 family protein [Treponema sp.]